MKPLIRSAYFTGEHLQPADFTAEQDFFLQWIQLANIGLVSSGVLSGLLVSLDDQGQLSISPGMALDGYGRQLILNQEVTLSPSTQDGIYYLTIRYRQSDADYDTGSQMFLYTVEEPLLSLTVEPEPQSLPQLHSLTTAALPLALTQPENFSKLLQTHALAPLLAVVTVSQGKLSLSDGLNQYQRRRCGLGLGSLHFGQASSDEQRTSIRAQPRKDHSRLEIVSSRSRIKGSFLVSGAFGIGQVQPAAMLSVNGLAHSGLGTISSADTTVTADNGIFLPSLQIGDEIIITYGVAGPSQTRSVTGVYDKGRVQVNLPFSPALSKVHYRVQYAILARFSSSKKANLLEIQRSGQVGLGQSATNEFQILLTEDGKVGIGNSQPVQALEVMGTLCASSFIGDGSALTHVTDLWQVNGNQSIYVSSDSASLSAYQRASVGMGSANPSAMLEVVGGDQFSGTGTLCSPNPTEGDEGDGSGDSEQGLNQAADTPEIKSAQPSAQPDAQHGASALPLNGDASTQASSGSAATTEAAGESKPATTNQSLEQQLEDWIAGAQGGASAGTEQGQASSGSGGNQDLMGRLASLLLDKASGSQGESSHKGLVAQLLDKFLPQDGGAKLIGGLAGNLLSKYAGAALGSFAGPLGMVVGSLAGDLISRLIGSGSNHEAAATSALGQYADKLIQSIGSGQSKGQAGSALAQHLDQLIQSGLDKLGTSGGSVGTDLAGILGKLATGLVNRETDSSGPLAGKLDGLVQKIGQGLISKLGKLSPAAQKSIQGELGKLSQSIGSKLGLLNAVAGGSSTGANNGATAKPSPQAAALSKLKTQIDKALTHPGSGGNHDQSADGDTPTPGVQISGNGTLFTSEIQPSDLLQVGELPNDQQHQITAQIRAVQSVTSDTKLVVPTAFDPQLTDSIFTIIKPIAKFFSNPNSPVIADSGGSTSGSVPLLTILPNQSVGINLAAPTATLDVYGTCQAQALVVSDGKGTGTIESDQVVLSGQLVVGNSISISGSASPQIQCVSLECRDQLKVGTQILCIPASESLAATLQTDKLQLSTALSIAGTTQLSLDNQIPYFAGSLQLSSSAAIGPIIQFSTTQVTASNLALATQLSVGAQFQALYESGDAQTQLFKAQLALTNAKLQGLAASQTSVTLFGPTGGPPNGAMTTDGFAIGTGAGMSAFNVSVGPYLVTIRQNGTYSIPVLIGSTLPANTTWSSLGFHS